MKIVEILKHIFGKLDFLNKKVKEKLFEFENISTLN
jgi:hypothetical protein